jgi:peptidoglycan hydrolase-like protein with peptidoglycan-binding domain
MNKFITAACALALAFAWSAAPALADDTVKDDKGVMEKTKDKAVEIKDKTKDKAVEIKDKTKDKAVEVKDKVKHAFKRDKTDKDMGMSGDVRSAQQALMDKGYNPGPIDGIQGPLTSAAVRDYQTKEGLKVTGRLDSETKARLNGSAASAPASAPPAASPATSGAGTAPSTQSK